MEMEKKISIEEYYAKAAREDKRALKNLHEQKLEFIPTGSWVVDRLVGNGAGNNQSGGLPRGHIVEIFGNESCGKSTLGISACVEAQRLGLLPMWLDFERTFSKDYAKKLGLDFSRFIFHEPDHFEQGAALIAKALPAQPAIIVVDSVSAMIPKAFLEADEGDPGRIGEHARLMSRFLPSMCKYIPIYNTSLVFLNQLRSVIKQSKYEYGPNEETSGGRALKFFASVRIKMQTSKIDYIKAFSRITGKVEDQPNNVSVKVKIIKNKVDKPHYAGPIYIKFGEGFDNITSIIDLADNCGVIRKSGAFYRFDSGDQTLFNVSGRENLREFLDKNPETLGILSSSVKLKVDEETKNEAAQDDQEPSENGSIESILEAADKTLLKNEPEQKPEQSESESKKRGRPAKK